MGTPTPRLGGSSPLSSSSGKFTVSNNSKRRKKPKLEKTKAIGSWQVGISFKGFGRLQPLFATWGYHARVCSEAYVGNLTRRLANLCMASRVLNNMKIVCESCSLAVPDYLFEGLGGLQVHRIPIVLYLASVRHLPEAGSQPL